MSINFKNRQSLRVVVIEPSAPLRSMILDSLRDLKFSKVQGFGTTQELTQLLNEKAADWIIMPLTGHKEISAIEILQRVTSDIRLKETLVSIVLIEESESYCLPSAFELGLFSFHTKSYTKEVILKEFETLIRISDRNDGNTTLTSAEYLRSHLQSKNLNQSLLSLEENLFAFFPGNPVLLMHLAEALFLNKNNARAERLLSQTALIEPRLKQNCDKIKARFTSVELAGMVVERIDQVENVLGIDHIVVVDPDTDVLHGTEQILKKLGVRNIKCFENAPDALCWLQTGKEPDLIIMEWRIPKLPGPIFVQRVRGLGFLQVPIIVASSLVKKDDIHLLKEMGVDDILTKPFEAVDFLKTVIWNLQQDRGPTELKALERKIRRLLAAKKMGEAERLIDVFLHDARIPEVAKLEIKAELHFHLNQFTTAMDEAMIALTHRPDSIHMLNLAGKSSLHLKDFNGALQYFERANQLSPMNIERLLAVAEIQKNAQQIDLAAVTINRALQVDPSNELSQLAQCQYEIEHGDSSKVNSLLERLESAADLTSYMNSRAISLSRNGRFEEGIALYQRTIAALPKRWKKSIAAVTYNLALAFVRYGDLEKAKLTLFNISDEGPIKTKSKSLSDKIQSSQRTGLPLKMNEATGLDEEAIPHNSGSDRSASGASPVAQGLAVVPTQKGDICCFLMFKSAEELDPRSTILLEAKKTA